MDPNLTAFVLLACACVTINATLVPMKHSCMKIRKGSTTEFKHYVRPIVLPLGQTWEITLPKCLDETSGVEVTGCDDDNIPIVKFTESSTVMVHRTGTLDSYIVVRFTLYCLAPQN